MVNEENNLTEEERKQREIFSKRNLIDGYLVNIAGSALAKSKKYGDFGDILDPKVLYDIATANTPNQQTYEQLILPFIKSDEPLVINRDAVSEKALKILQESLQDIPVSEILKMLGANFNLNKKYQEKYVTDLSDDEKKVIDAAYFRTILDQKILEVIGVRRELRMGGLEQMFAIERREVA